MVTSSDPRAGAAVLSLQARLPQTSGIAASPRARAHARTRLTVAFEAM